MRIVIIIATSVWLLSAGPVQAGEPSGYYVVETSTKYQVQLVELEADGKTVKKNADGTLKFKMENRTKPGKKFIVVKRVWFRSDLFLEVPSEKTGEIWNNEEAGTAIQLPIGWDGWDEVSGEELKRVKARFKAAGDDVKYFGNPSQPTITIRVQVDPVKIDPGIADELAKRFGIKPKP